MHVIVVCATDDDTVDLLILFTVLDGVNSFEVGQGHEDRLPVSIVLGFNVGPSIVVLGLLGLILCITVHVLC